MTTTRESHTAGPDDGDYWYLNRHLLEEGQIFRTYDGSLVKLDRRVPGDGTQWYVANLYSPGRFLYEDSIIEPGDLRGNPLTASEARNG